MGFPDFHFGLCPLPLGLSLGNIKKSRFDLFSLLSHIYTRKISFLSLLSQPLLIRHMLQSLNYLHGHSLDLLQYSHVSLSCTEHPSTGHSTPHVSHLGSERRRITSRDLLEMLCRIMLNWAQLGVQQHALLCRDTSQLVSPQCVLGHMVIPPQMQNFTFPCVELDGVLGCPYLQPDRIPLMAAQPSGASVTFPILLSSPDLLRLRSVPPSR